MATIECPVCGIMISPNAAACPKCGEPMAAKRMPPPVPPVAKTGKSNVGCIPIVGALIVIFLLAAVCSSLSETKQKALMADQAQAVEAARPKSSLEQIQLAVNKQEYQMFRFDSLDSASGSVNVQVTVEENESNDLVRTGAMKRALEICRIVTANPELSNAGAIGITIFGNLKDLYGKITVAQIGKITVPMGDAKAIQYQSVTYHDFERLCLAKGFDAWHPAVLKN